MIQAGDVKKIAGDDYVFKTYITDFSSEEVAEEITKLFKKLKKREKSKEVIIVKENAQVVKKAGFFSSGYGKAEIHYWEKVGVK